ncbi:peptidase S26A- signal peptidase I- serine active site protein [Apiospora saccharicola]|uniref:Signal peptidase complex catalytic subunit SEC11 n=1 Tax=Apiospora saccharicola TaxID=335842 RepID=A0ABR1UX70_9PEZI
MMGGLQNPRQLAAQVLNFGLILSTAFMVSKLPPGSHAPATFAFQSVFSTGMHYNKNNPANNSCFFPPKQMWKGLSVISDSPSPIVVVLSGSMEPAFQRGDLLFLWNRNVMAETDVGEVVVYNVKDKDIPIVHRVVRKFGEGEHAKLLTKGDNNAADDTELYARGQDYLERKDIIGSVFAYIPFVGYVTIMLSEHPWLKTVMLGIMGLLVVLQRE